LFHKADGSGIIVHVEIKHVSFLEIDIGIFVSLLFICYLEY